jgi:hypothetical protein
MAQAGLYKALTERSISTQTFLSTYNVISEAIVRLGKVFDSIEELETYLMKEFLLEEETDGFVSWMTQHEKEHEKIANEYCLSSKFVYVDANPIKSVWCWDYDIAEKAKNWEIDKLIEYEQKHKIIDESARRNNPLSGLGYLVGMVAIKERIHNKKPSSGS